MHDFDIQKYRNENPMDYIVAASLIERASNVDEVAQHIYKVTRLHIPDSIYKYVSFTDNRELNDLKIETLLHKKIHLSQAVELNDPFDGQGFFYKKSVLKTHPELFEINGSIFDDFTRYQLIASFTKVGVNNMPMWAHYSNNHSGFCIEYEPKKNNNKFTANLFPVQYTDKRIDITYTINKLVTNMLAHKKKSIDEYFKNSTSEMLPTVFITLFLSCVKHNSWSYEKEVRFITSNTHDSSTDAIPSAIYMGIKCPESYKIKLKEIARKINIPIFQMQFEEESSNYELRPREV